MLRLTRVHNGLRINQEITSPSVYLDHWAWREISDSNALASRFVNALASRSGTLAISWLNVVEFSKVSDESQRLKADALLNRLALNTFWLNPDFFTVAEHEGKPPPGNTPPAHSDIEFAAFFVDEALRAPHPPGALGPANLFTAIQKTPPIRQQYDDLADEIISHLEELRTRYQASWALRQAADSSPPKEPATRATKFITRHMILRLLKDTLQKLDRNNAIDLSHAVVSASYCDYVLLDAQWAGLVNEARRLLAKPHLSLPVAKAFSKRSNGMEAFLTDLERLA